jgi:hypothetical protein
MCCIIDRYMLLGKVELFALRKGGDKMKEKPRVASRLIGGERDDFEVVQIPVPVSMKTTLRERIVNALWVIAAGVIATTIATVLIVPLLQ